jgi:serine/threonine protein kinase
MVTGFGDSYMYPVSEPLAGRSSRTLLPYAAPEEVFGAGDHHLGFPADVWALGVSIAHVRYGILPFIEGVDMPYEIDRVDLCLGIAKMERFMGPMPHPYRVVWKAKCRTMFATLEHHVGPPDCDLCPDEDSEGLTALEDDDEGWNDETVPTTTDTAEQEPGSHGLGIQQEGHWPDGEAEQMLHLLSQIFRWHPEQRATLDQIAHHGWFGNRRGSQRKG